MRTRAALAIATIPLLAGCRAFPAPAPAGTAYATTLVSPSHYQDATILSCGPGATAEVSITNSSAVTAAYTVRINYRVGVGPVVTVGVLHALAIPAGGSTTAQVPGNPVGGTVTCSLGDVHRQ